MINKVVRHNNELLLVLLKTGSAHLALKVEAEPNTLASVLDVIITSNDPVYLNRYVVVFGLINDADVIAEVEEGITLSLLAIPSIGYFLAKTVQNWAQGDMPSWSKDCLEDIRDYMLWYTGETPVLKR